jgi:hypothetical protein
MKRCLLALTSLLALSSPAYAFDWDSWSSYRAERARQLQRIEEGRASGALTRWEYRHLLERQRMLDRLRFSAFTSGGRATSAEQRRLSAMLSRESQRIARLKSN